MDIESVEDLRRVLGRGVPLGRLRLQGLDLRDHADLLTGRDDVEGLVVLGGRLPSALARHLTRHGAVVLPPAPQAPVDPYRGRLYTADELYAGLGEHGYDATPDARAYAWATAPHLRRDAYVTVLRATHDAAMDDALDDLLEGRRVVGVMGGHALRRGEGAYADAARLGFRLARAGLVVATGGGPGAMEAANLGAMAAGVGGVAGPGAGDPADAGPAGMAGTTPHAPAGDGLASPDGAHPGTGLLRDALDALAEVPGFVPDVGRWAELGLRVRDELLAGHPDRGLMSVGIPTWFYGHEPPNVFCDAIGKFFSNAVREDGLLARCTAGIVVLRGAAGTVQEIFQAATPRYYAGAGDAAPSGHAPAPASPLVLVDRDYWTRQVPVWDALRALGERSPLGPVLHLVDDLDEAAAIVRARPGEGVTSA